MEGEETVGGAAFVSPTKEHEEGISPNVNITKKVHLPASLFTADAKGSRHIRVHTFCLKAIQTKPQVRFKLSVALPSSPGPLKAHANKTSDFPSLVKGAGAWRWQGMASPNFSEPSKLPKGSSNPAIHT